VIKWPVKLYVRFFYVFTFFLEISKHDFLRFLSFYTFSRKLASVFLLAGGRPVLSRPAGDYQE